MCFGGGSTEAPKTPAPPKPPTVLEQAEPVKKSMNQKGADALSIGTKKYQNNSGLSTPTSNSAPTGLSLN